MSWECRLITYQRESNGKSLNVGDMFYGPTKEEVTADDLLTLDRQRGLWWPYAMCKDRLLSDYYRQHNAHRRPLLVFMPGRVLFCVDAMITRDGLPAGGGWSVSGEAPLITVSPSINMQGIYHGYIQNGIITDDCEGRVYKEDGRIQR